MRDNAAAAFRLPMSTGFLIDRFIHCFCVSNARKGNTTVVTARREMLTCSWVITRGSGSSSSSGSGSTRASSNAASNAVRLSPFRMAAIVATLSVGAFTEFCFQISRNPAKTSIHSCGDPSSNRLIVIL